MQNASRLRQDAIAIWTAGVESVGSERLVANAVRRDGERLVICDQEFRIAALRRIAAVGAGKAGAGMAAALERALGDELLAEKVSGWVNVPADCARPLRRIYLHPARPAGVNEPTDDGVCGASRILEIVSQLGPDELCLVLISGGGSALLPAPVEGISLADKQTVTRLLMNAGATIHELNCVRKQLSRIKGGGLARAASRAGHVLTLIISDVVGDPLDVIASGPTVANTTTAADALAVLRKYAPDRDAVPEAVWRHLERAALESNAPPPVPENVRNYVIGNNAIALRASAERAESLGYRVHSLGSDDQGEARQVGRELAELCRSIRDQDEPLAAPACVLSGGEPVVHLVPTDRPRKGGRNQEVALAALERLREDGLKRVVLLSGGTDGEDGPTDAAGAVSDADVLESARSQGLDPAEFLSINNAYPFFERTGGLLKTGPTHTNVMDVRVGLVAAEASEGDERRGE